MTVALPNDGMTLHNFSIDALGISVDIAPGETQEGDDQRPCRILRVLLQRAGAQAGRDGGNPRPRHRYGAYSARQPQDALS